MLEGVDVYRDRDKYLLRSLQVTGRMENLISEMLEISRMETGTAAIRREPVTLSGLLERQLALDAELLEQRGQRLASTLTPGVLVGGMPRCWARPLKICFPMHPFIPRRARRSGYGAGERRNIRR